MRKADVSEYKRLCGEVWDALGVPPERQEGDPTARVEELHAAARAVVECFLGKDRPGWVPGELRSRIMKLQELTS